MRPPPPRTPLKAYHRLIQTVMTVLDEDVEHFPKEFDLIERVFQRAGGSWARAFDGSVKDILMLKRVIRVAVKKGYVTKKPAWSTESKIKNRDRFD